MPILRARTHFQFSPVGLWLCALALWQPSKPASELFEEARPFGASGLLERPNWSLALPRGYLLFILTRNARLGNVIVGT